MQAGLVSVMMPAFNAAAYIGEAIESVLAQSYTQWELLIINDGSTDDTPNIIARYRDPRIRVTAQANAGEAAARNRALDLARGEFLAFLDADDIFLPDHLERTISFLQAHPAHHGVYTDGYYCDAEGNRLRPLSSQRRGPFEGNLFEELVRASDVFGPPLSVVLRTVWIGMRNLTFDPEIVIGPDWDFLTRFAEGATFGYLPQHTGLYRLHDTSITVQVDRDRRSLYLARCREKAIRTKSFPSCALETRAAAFYDLLVVQLQGRPERQDNVTSWPEFSALPDLEQSRLLRLMASEALGAGNDHPQIGQWLARARATSPSDARAAILNVLYTISPGACRTVLRARRRLSRIGGQHRPAGSSALSAIR